MSAENSTYAANQRRTADQALDCLEDIALEKGLDALSMRDVATRVGISLAALQYHYPSKADLLDAFVVRTIGQLRDEVSEILKPSDRSPRLPAFVRHMVEATANGRQAALIAMIWARSLHDDLAANSLTELMQVYISSVRDMVIADNPEIDEADANTAATLIVAMIEGSATAFPSPQTQEAAQEQTLDAAVRIAAAIPKMLQS